MIVLEKNYCKLKPMEIIKPIIQRSNLDALSLITELRKIKYNYVKQRNLFVALLRKNKREFFGNLNEKNVCNNKKLFSMVDSLLSNKFFSNEEITLVEDGNNVENDKNTISFLNEFFSNIITNLGVESQHRSSADESSYKL